jgi:hypothetical protein
MADEEHRGAAVGDPAHPMDRLPWPNVRGKRCLDLGAPDHRVAAELKRRGGAEVISVDGTAELDPELGAFDVVVGVAVLAQVDAPLDVLQVVRRLTRGVFLSAEPIDLWTSVLGRGRPLFTLESGAGSQRFRFNGAGHKHLLDAAGFAVERVSRPYTVGGPPPGAGSAGRDRVDGLATRVLTGSWDRGVLHRALLARPRS